jgi:hypothetical protein
VMYRGFSTKISASTGILAVLLVSFLLILSFNLIIAIAEPSRVVSTLYVGFKAVDRYTYEDVIVDVVYLNPRIYYILGIHMLFLQRVSTYHLINQ